MKTSKKAIRKKFKEAHRIPEPYGSIMDQMMDRDRTYFEQHPTATAYVRTLIPGEQWPNGPLPPATLVRVHQMQPGVRMRQFLLPEAL